MYFYVLLFVLATVNAVTKPKLCVNCHHYVPREGLSPEYGRCRKFLVPTSLKYNLVCQHEPHPNQFVSCSAARSFESYCGEEAKEYQRKRVRKPKAE